MKKCSKISYPSKEEATKDAKYIHESSRTRKKNRTKKDAKKLQPYNCPYCGMWHLTTQKQRKY